METLFQLVFTFFKIGLFSIGGGYAIIPLIQDQVVDHFGWISQDTFSDIITISQMTPGPIAVNTSTFVGIQIAGIWGAILATFGCVISGITVSVFLYCFFQKHRQSDYIMEILSGLKASSLGLIMTAAFTIVSMALIEKSPHGAGSSLNLSALLLFLCAFFALRKWKLHPIFLMVVAGVAGWIIY